MVVSENNVPLRKCILKYLGVKGYDVFNLLSSGSAKITVEKIYKASVKEQLVKSVGEFTILELFAKFKSLIKRHK